MKILAVSDEVVDSLYHSNIKRRFGDVQLVLGCGDLPYYYLEFIVSALDVPLYYVPGNHDHPIQYASDGRTLDRAAGCEPLDGQVVQLRLPGAAPLLLAGLGGCMRYNADGVHQYTALEMETRMWRLLPRLSLNRVRSGRALDIFVAHSPPRGIHDGQDRAHTGFEAFRHLMDVARPRYLLHGHSHVYRSDTVTRTEYRETTVLNVYPYRLLEI